MIKTIIVSFALSFIPFITLATALNSTSTKQNLTIAEFFTNGIYPNSAIQFLLWFEN